MFIILFRVGTETEHFSDKTFFEMEVPITMNMIAVATLFGDLLINSTHDSSFVHNLLHCNL